MNLNLSTDIHKDLSLSESSGEVVKEFENNTTPNNSNNISTTSEFKLNLCDGRLNDRINFKITCPEDCREYPFKLVGLKNYKNFENDTNNTVYFLFCLHVTKPSGKMISVNYFEKKEYLIRCIKFTQKNNEVNFSIKKTEKRQTKFNIVRRIMIINKPGRQITLTTNRVSNFTLSLFVKIYFQGKKWETNRIELPSKQKIRGKLGELSQATPQSEFKLNLCSGILTDKQKVRFKITCPKDYCEYPFKLVNLENHQNFKDDTNDKIYFLFCLNVTKPSGEIISANYFEKEKYLIRCTSFTQADNEVNFTIEKAEKGRAKRIIIEQIMIINNPGRQITLPQVATFTLSLFVKIYFQGKSWETNRITLPTSQKRRSLESSDEVVKEVENNTIQSNSTTNDNISRGLLPLERSGDRSAFNISPNNFPNNPRKRKSPESSGEVVKEFENHATQNNFTNISTTNDNISRGLLPLERSGDQSVFNMYMTDPLWIFMRNRGLAGEKNRIYHLLKQHKVTLNELYQSPHMIREILQSASEYITLIHDVVEKSLKLSKIEPAVIKVMDLEKKPCFITLSSQTSFPDGLNFNVRFGTKNSQTNQWVMKTTFWLPDLAPEERLCPVPNFKEFNNPNEQLVFSCTDKGCEYRAQISLEQELAFTSQRVEKISSQPLCLYYSF